MTTVTNLTTGAQVLAQLATYNLKDCGGGRYRSHSPLRPESNSQSFSLFIQADGEHGMFKDHVSGEGGSLYALARLLGIPRPESGDSSATSKRAYAGLGDYAAAHGADYTVFSEAGWREGRLGNRPALFFKTANGERWRYLDGEQPKYGNKTGYKSCWYGLRKAVSFLVYSPNKVLVLCNGEASTVAAQHHGVPAVCVTNSGERSDLNPELIEELKEALGDAVVPILVAYDCDDKGRSAALPMARALAAKGFNARAVDLALGFQGADLADFCKLYGGDAFGQLLQCPTLEEQQESLLPLKGDYQSVTLWKGYDITELDSLPKVAWLIHQEIVENEINVLYGLPGSGKSFKALDYSMRVANEKGPVLYLAYEGESGYLGRALAWCTHHQIALEMFKNKVHFIMGHLELMERDDFISLAEIVKRMNPRLIVIDTLGRAMTGLDAKEGKDVNLFMKMCTRLKTVFNCSILLVHHSNKAGKEEYGSVYLRASAASAILISDDDGLITVESIKTKDGAKFQPYQQRLLPVTATHKGETYKSAVLLDAKKVMQTNQDPLSPNQIRALQLLALDIYADGMSPKDIKAEADIPPTGVSRTLNRLLSLGFITKTGFGMDVNYRITDLGREKLAHLADSPDSGDSPDSLDSEKAQGHFFKGGESPESPESGYFESYAESFGANVSDRPIQGAFINEPVRYE